MYFNMLEGEKGDKRRISEMFWGRRGWTSKGLAGSYVGCPEMPDGSKLHHHYVMSLLASINTSAIPILISRVCSSQD